MQITADEIENIISGLIKYEKRIKRKLRICHIKYKKDFDDVKDQYGYVEEGIEGLVDPYPDYKSINKIYFCSCVIAKNINMKFGRIGDRDTFNKMVEVYVKNVLVHELVHAKQIIKKEITKERIEDSRRLPYCERAHEIEADDYAAEIVGSEGEFEKYIIVNFFNKCGKHMSIDNDVAKDLIKMFNTFYISI